MNKITLKNLRSFNKNIVVKRICNFIEKKLQESEKEKVIIGVSGGIDSSLTLKLVSKVVKPENIIAIFLPDKVTPNRDAVDAQKLCKMLDIDLKKIRIDEVIDTFHQKIPINNVDKKTLGNLKARARMLFLYIFSNELNGLVVGTGDKSEWLIGYFTKWGDGVADFAPIQGLYKIQVKTLAKFLKLPASITEKKSTPGLWKNQTVESELGMSYKEIDKVLFALFEKEIEKTEIPEVTGVSSEVVAQVMDRWKNSTHKRKMPTTVDPFTE